MNLRRSIAPSVILVLFLTGPAGGNPIVENGLIAHYAAQITFSNDLLEGGWDQTYSTSPVTGPEDLRVRIDVGETPLGVVWYVLGAWYMSREWGCRQPSLHLGSSWMPVPPASDHARR